MNNRYIPLLPSLSVIAFFSRKKRVSPFPLGTLRRDYYFERNAIWEAVHAFGLEKGDEILMPAYNSGTEEEVLEAAGLTLNFYDTQRDTRLSITHLEERVTERTRVLYVIHYFGHAQPLDEIAAFCKKHQLLLFEDCALSLFSKDREQWLGSAGDAGFFCLRKYLPIPNGGSVVYNGARSSVTESHDMTMVVPSFVSTFIELVGLLFKGMVRRLPLLKSLFAVVRWMVRAVFSSVKIDSGDPHFATSTDRWGISRVSSYLLDRFDYDVILQKRMDNYQYITSKLRALLPRSSGVRLFGAHEQEGFAPFCLLLIVSDNQVWEHALRARSIEAGAWWWNEPHPLGKGHCENNVWLRKHVLEIPIHQGLDTVDMDYIVFQIQDILKSGG